MTDDSHDLPLFVRDLVGWYSIALLGLGRTTGLLEALFEGPGTAAEIAARAGVDTRNAFEWLRGLTAAGHVTHRAGVFSAADETSMVFGAGFPVDARKVLDFTMAAPAVNALAAQAIRSGQGIRSDQLTALSSAAGGVNSPTYAATLVTEWIAGIEGLTATLQKGGSAADLAAGNGDAAGLIATAFPAATVIGYDIAPTPRAGLPSNVEMTTADVRDLPETMSFDFVYCLDSFHHFGDPALVLAQARKVLAPDGVVMIVESDLTGDIDADSANPFAVVVYACGLLYCLQENLASGGTGHSNGDGPQWVMDAMTAAGFSDVSATASAAGYNVITCRAA
jgi:SAM-dependent methyltransferase